MKNRVFDVPEEDLLDGTQGICLACGHMQDGVEPDARGYVCDSCEAEEVYGLEEAFIMGRIRTYEEDEEGEEED